MRQGASVKRTGGKGKRTGGNGEDEEKSQVNGEAALRMPAVEKRSTRSKGK
jgi:hypothetical protein